MAQVTVNANQITSPVWAGDFLNREHLVPGGARVDAAQFPATDAVTVTVGAAGALVDDTAVPVAALGGPIPSGTVLDFGDKKLAVLTAAAVAGATILTVRAIPTALVSGDVATYAGVGRVVVQSGTAVCASAPLSNALQGQTSARPWTPTTKCSSSLLKCQTRIGTRKSSCTVMAASSKRTSCPATPTWTPIC